MMGRFYNSVYTVCCRFFTILSLRITDGCDVLVGWFANNVISHPLLIGAFCPYGSLFCFAAFKHSLSRRFDDMCINFGRRLSDL